MGIWWGDINKLFKFIVSTFLGFFLITLNFIFGLSKNNTMRLLIAIILISILYYLYNIIKLMLG